MTGDLRQRFDPSEAPRQPRYACGHLGISGRSDVREQPAAIPTMGDRWQRVGEPSRLGEHLRVHLFHDRQGLFQGRLGAVEASHPPIHEFGGLLLADHGGFTGVDPHVVPLARVRLERASRSARGSHGPWKIGGREILVKLRRGRSPPGRGLTIA